MFRFFALIAALCCAAPVRAAAHDAGYTMMGAKGLITVPSARMDKSGTITAQISAAEPYMHAMAGIQFVPALHINIRQTGRMTSPARKPERVYPGVDLRLRLREETPYGPAIVLGLQSAIGHKRMAAEYLAFSKRYDDWDFTAGMAWGRLGSAAHIKNPLAKLHRHFDKPRSYDDPSIDEKPHGPSGWFTGPDMGFFAGVEYHAPFLRGLRLQAEYGADRYAAERASFAHDAPSPWSFGAAYRPHEALDIGAALIGGDRFMLRATMRGDMHKWRGRGDKPSAPITPQTPRPLICTDGPQIIAAAADHDMTWRGARFSGPQMATYADISPHVPLPRQIGRALRHSANHSAPDIDIINVTPTLYGLRGPSVQVLRRDAEQAFAHNNGSPQEIWRNARFNAPHGLTPEKPPRRFPFLGLNDDTRLSDIWRNARFILDTEMSLAEEDNGVIYRTGLILETQQRLTRNAIAGTALRFNLGGNLHRLNRYRPYPLLPVREDIDAFTQNGVTLERAYMGWFKSFKTDWHAMLATGYLEEMYYGSGGEILYRPFGKTYAIGAEAWHAMKRDPFSSMATGLNGDQTITAHINAWYEVPDSDLTVHARVGRYLGSDYGATLALRHGFTHGGHIEAFTTATNRADYDLFGGKTHLYTGMKMVLPIGNVKFIPQGSAIRVKTAQMGRMSGQALDKPHTLYDMTDAFSLRQIARDWQTIGE